MTTHWGGKGQRPDREGGKEGGGKGRGRRQLKDQKKTFPWTTTCANLHGCGFSPERGEKRNHPGSVNGKEKSAREEGI